MTDPGFDIVSDIDTLGGPIEFAPELNGRPEDAAELALTIATLEDFAAVDEASAEPLLGDEETTLLSLGGMMVLYGDGGAGKTTLELDLICHLASGTPWQGLPSARPCRILVIENEGPRGMFRKKVRRKLAAWQGVDLSGQVYVLEDPWALFSFDKEVFRAHLHEALERLAIDVVAAGPVNRLGIQGGGTPEEVGAFILNIELVRQALSRPVAVIFAHHENKAGDVSGAWEGVPDTLGHVQAQGHGKTRVKWQKVRWGPSLHGKVWELNWAEGEQFELQEKEERSDASVETELIDFIRDHPGSSWRAVREGVQVQDGRLGKMRDRLLKEGRIENRGGPNRMILYLAAQMSADDDIPF